MSRVRHSIQQLQQWYDDGNREPLEKLVKAWRGIQGKKWDDDDGFFIIGGFHGEPFHGAGISDSNNWWGGYCNHANVLFPTWHRAYVLRLEDALRTVEGCEDVTMAFWDEYAYYNPFPPVPPVKPEPVIPAVLTSPTFPLDGNDVPNPFYSYTFLKGLTDAIDDKHRYDKPAGYTTVRYPLSGLVGTEADAKATEAYNSQFKENAVKLLNDNVRAWLNPGAKIPERGGGERIPDFTSIGRRLELCMDAPNYMLFSNTTSAGQYTADYGGDDKHYVVSLESPHNAMHLAVGGFFQSGIYNANPWPGLNANGDMGENNTASLDPIFWFHHTFIDYCFWTWQNRWGLTQKGSLSVEWGYPGTNSSDYPSVPPAQTQANVQLNMDSPLYPFKKADKTWYTSHDVTDIADLGYSYGPGTMDKFKHKGGLGAPPPTELGSLLQVTGINRLDYKGSFVVRTYARLEDGTRYEVGRDEILSRWNVSGCQNCQNHLGVRSFAPIHPEVQRLLDDANGEVGYVVEVSHHGSDKPELVKGAIVQPLKKVQQ